MDGFTMFQIHAEVGRARTPPTYEPPSDTYQPLPNGCIRLLKIKPGDSSAVIECETQIYPLNGGLVYTAISYEWGARPADRTIVLNGHPLRVRRNAWFLLSQLRQLGYDKTSNLLWIDLLCINQSDNGERTRQVALMPQIYKTAAKVTIWLGTIHRNGDRAMQALARPTSYWRAKNNLHTVWAKDEGTAIASLCKRGYWNRLWIFQELMLAQEVEVMCGSKTISWRLFRDFLLDFDSTTPGKRVIDKEAYQTARMSPALSFVRLTAHKPSEATLWNLMTGTQHLLCAEPRDKVYALLGVASAGHENISPDYSTPIPMLLNMLLRNHHQLQPPQSIEEVVKECEQLTKQLGINPDAIFILTGRDEHFTQPSEGEEARFPFRWPTCPITLWWVAYYGHSAVEALFWKRSVVNCDASLIDAAICGCEAAVQVLLWTGRVSVNVGDDKHRTPLYWAAKYRRVSVMKLLFDTGKVNANATDENGDTALHQAAAQGFIDVVDLLIGTDQIDINAKDALGETPLLQAARYGRVEIVQVLLNTGNVNLHAADNNGNTALYEAVARGHMEVAHLLISTDRIEINANHTQGRNAYQPASQPAFLQAARCGRVDVMIFLLETGTVDVNAANRYGNTALHGAAYEGREEAVRLLIGLHQSETTTSKNSYDDDNDRHHHQQSHHHHRLFRPERFGRHVVDIVGWSLLDHKNKVNVDLANHFNETPTQLAALNGHQEVVNLLRGVKRRRSSQPATATVRPPLPVTRVGRVGSGSESSSLHVVMSRPHSPLGLASTTTRNRADSAIWTAVKPDFKCFVDGNY